MSSEFIEPKLTPIAREILKRRYLIKDENGEPVETPKDMFLRVAKTIAEVERDYGADDDTINDLTAKFYEMMASGKWLPNSPTLMNAGRPLGQLSACFVLPVADEMTNGKDGIYDTLRDMAIIHKSGGGTGFSFSSLRPADSIVRSTTGVASGPVSFMSLYDASTNVVKQGGTRRGANMGIIRVDHPDVLQFIDCKQDTSKITNFNISVAVTNEFMEAVKKDDDWPLTFNGKVYDVVRAKDLWEKICMNAWRTGEPGLFFIDEANKHNPVPHLGDYEATNPCGEQPLLAYDVCNLGSLNLGVFVKENGEVNWSEMREYIWLSVRFLDNVIDANNYPLSEIHDLAQRIRRIGNGVMGFADMLIKMGVPYGSEESIELANSVAKFFVAECLEASEALAEEKGSFPEWELSIFGQSGRKMRNCNVTTVAPTGTISIIAGCSSGIEPLYAVVFKRNQAGVEAVDAHPQFRKDLEKWNVPDNILEEVYNAGTVDIQAVPADLRAIYKTSGTVSPIEHIDMQIAWQKHICSAISKTINLPHESTVQDVADAYMRAYDGRCKGVTVYRDGSRPGQVLSTGKTESKKATKAFMRPDVLDGRTHKVDTPIGRMYITVNTDPSGEPMEVFVSVGKAGGSTMANSEAIGRLVSLCLRSGISVDAVYRQLRGISSERALGFGKNRVLSGPDAVAQVLREYADDPDTEPSDNGHEFAACPECHAELSFEEGCYVCHACGYAGCA